MNDVQIRAVGKKAFIDAVKSNDVQKSLRQLTAQQLYCLSKYLKYLGNHEGVPGMVIVLARSEKERRFDESQLGALKAKDPIGNTVAEGLDMAERGEQF